MLQKIYFLGKPLFLTSEITPEIEELLHHEETIFIDEFNSHTVKAMIHELQLDKIIRGVFLHPDVEAMIDAFKKKLTLVKAGGGLVVAPGNFILMIFRKGKWDLPKGKLEEGEKIADCAHREVMEETGIEQLKTGKLLGITYHTYRENGRHVIKESHWFMMKAGKKEELSPQTEEDITECKWVSLDDVNEYRDKAYDSIRDVLDMAQERILSASGK
jgi:ADP-ribose pyrophosphatase YjhB (NUDIX family)